MLRVRAMKLQKWDVVEDSPNSSEEHCDPTGPAATAEPAGEMGEAETAVLPV